MFLRAGRAGQGRAVQGQAGQVPGGQGRAGLASPSNRPRRPGSLESDRVWEYSPHPPNQTKMTLIVRGLGSLMNGRDVNGRAGSLQSLYTGRLYPPSPF